MTRFTTMSLCIIFFFCMFSFCSCKKIEYPLAEADSPDTVIHYEDPNPNANQWPQ